MKIAVLLSGGVDSSVALLSLKEQGHELTAFYLKIWLEDELAYLGDCPWEEDLAYAGAVCRQLGVPLEIISLQREYFEKVVSYTIAELRAGYTPSPDIFCNERIKFGVFLDRIDAGYEKVASGHYARVEERGGRFVLKRSPDPVKDQTYFLAHLTQGQLARALFPVGDKEKAEVRALARTAGLATRDRKDSQGICFLGKIKFNDFARYHLGERPGAILDIDTLKDLGRHRGYWYHTIGQRRGLGLSGGPWYVMKKDIEHNIIYVSHQENLLQRSQDRFIVADCHWITPPEREELRVKIRHAPKFYDCRLRRGNTVLPEGGVEVALAEKDPGIAPGQFAVFYDGDICLGCGKIQY